jgi:hypothetical protein
VRRWAGRFAKQHHRSRINAGRPPGEHAPVGGQIDLQIGKREPDRASLRGHGGFFVEVMRALHETG